MDRTKGQHSAKQAERNLDELRRQGWWSGAEFAWEPSRTDLLRWRAIARDAARRADEHIIRLDAKTALFLERLVGTQTLYIYRNEDYTNFGLNEREFVPFPSWLSLCKRQGEPVLPWQWSNYTLKANYWKSAFTVLGRYGVMADSSMRINEMNVLLRVFVKSGKRVQTHTFEVDRRKASEVEAKIAIWQQTKEPDLDPNDSIIMDLIDYDEYLGGVLDFS